MGGFEFVLWVVAIGCLLWLVFDNFFNEGDDGE